MLGGKLPTVWLLTSISFFEAVPSLMTGLRVGVGLALIISTLTEMFMGAGSGMGQTLMEAYSIYDLPRMYAYILTLGLTGFLLNRICVVLEVWSGRWSTT